jgi:hypothetical protein
VRELTDKISLALEFSEVVLCMSVYLLAVSRIALCMSDYEISDLYWLFLSTSLPFFLLLYYCFVCPRRIGIA